MIPPELLNTITTGDARELAKAIPDESVDLIFTDPVYANMDDYSWLAETAMRVLKPNAGCLVFCAIGLLPETHDALRAGGLSYRWRLIVRPVHAKEFNGRLLVTTQECLWYQKGRSPIYQSLFDCLLSTTKSTYLVGNANWGKGIYALTRYVATFSRQGDVVYDPFTGGGSIPAVCKMLSRHFIASEIDPDTAERARLRVLQTQPPLPGLEYEQAELAV